MIRASLSWLIVVSLSLTPVSTPVQAGELPPESPTAQTPDLLGWNALLNGQPSPVERTGQYLCHDVDGLEIDCTSTLHDGDLRTGLEWPVPRFVDQGDGTIADQLTGLEWLADAACLGEETWLTALANIDDLNGGTDFTCTGYTPGTHADWRLPNLKELLSLIDYSQTTPAIVTGHPFVNLLPSLYWSSTSYVASPSTVFGVEMSTGADNVTGKDSTWSGWAVRGSAQAGSDAPVERTGQTNCYSDGGVLIACAGTGQDGELQAGVAWPVPRFTDNGDGTIFDVLTGLTWLKDANCLGEDPWEDILSTVPDFNDGTDLSCVEYIAGDFTDWRLPNVRELHSLIDYGSHSPALPPGHPFANIVSGPYWSSTTLANSTDWAHNVDLQSGVAEGQNKADAGPGWAVRGGLFTTGEDAVDQSFGDQGLVSTDFSGNSGDRLYDALLQPDGKIIGVGVYNPWSPDNDFALARYDADGVLDPTFGMRGLVTTDLGSNGFDLALDAALQADGKIVATGRHAVGSPSVRYIGLVRYLSDGSLDPAFGTGGIVITDIGDDELAIGIAIQPDGKILVTGRVGTTDIDMAILRYDTGGVLDPTFGTGGIVTLDIGGMSDSAAGAAVRSDGRIVIAGRSSDPSTGIGSLVIAQYLSDGTLDASFGTGGIVIAEFATGANDRPGGGPVLQPDGKILVNGYSATPTDTDIALARFTSAGALDPTFGTGGTVVVGLGSDEFLLGTPVLDAAGNIVVTGETGFGSQSNYFKRFLFGARFLPDGTIDSDIWSNGFVVLDLGPGPYDSGAQALLVSDERIVFAGFTDTANGNFALTRVLINHAVFADGFESGDLSEWSNSVP